MWADALIGPWFCFLGNGIAVCVNAPNEDASDCWYTNCITVLLSYQRLHTLINWIFGVIVPDMIESILLILITVWWRVDMMA